MPTRPLQIPQAHAYIANKRITRNIHRVTSYPGKRDTGWLLFAGDRIQVWRVGSVWLTKGGLASWGLSTDA